MCENRYTRFTLGAIWLGAGHLELYSAGGFPSSCKEKILIMEAAGKKSRACDSIASKAAILSKACYPTDL